MTLRLDIDLPSSLVRGPEAAAAAEAAGYHAGWFPETRSDPLLVAAAASASTRRLRLGTAVTVAFARSPYVTAQAAWELAGATRGRFTLGLGSQVKGHIERRFAAPWSEPAARLREYLLALRELWAAFAERRTPDFRGRFYTHTLLPEAFLPAWHPHGDIPILLAAVNPRMAEVAGEVADGIVVHPLHSPAYLDEVLLPALDRGLQRAGRTRADVRVLVPVWAVVGTVAEREPNALQVRERIAFYGATRTYARVFAAHGWGDVPDRLHAALAAGDREALLGGLPDGALETFAIVCEPEDLAGQLRRRLEGRADSCMLYAPVPERVWAEHLPAVIADLNG